MMMASRIGSGWGCALRALEDDMVLARRAGSGGRAHRTAHLGLI